MGSGTTAKASVQTERDYLGSEISEEYYKICLERLKVSQ
jgi:DNA modification methylase